MGRARLPALALVLTVGCGSADAPAPPGLDGNDDAASTPNDGAPLDGAPLDGAPFDAEQDVEMDAAGPDAPPWVPDPVPAVDPEPPAACSGIKPGYFQFLDDACDAKVQPTDFDPEFRCPIVATSAPGFRAASEPVVVEDVLGGIVPAGLAVTVIVVRRVDGVPRYRYLSNGTSSTVFQPWSTTKFLAAANAAATVRKRSDYQIGFSASVDGVPVGDLVTAVHAYDPARWSSNSISRWFHDVGGRANANALIHEAWLQRPSSETFGGNYGAAAPPLGHTFVEPSGASVSIVPDSSTGPANALSTRTLAEALKRLVMHREDESTRLPGIQWADVRVLLHGAPTSKWYPGQLGGMTADTAIYLQAGHDIEYLRERARGRFRIYSKLGFGSGQFVHVGYACLPVLDPSGAPVADAGDELFIAARLASGGTTDAERDRSLARAYRAIMSRLLTRAL